VLHTAERRDLAVYADRPRTRASADCDEMR
jgi:hypothetical protein